jgi:hypothetical protein
MVCFALLSVLPLVTCSSAHKPPVCNSEAYKEYEETPVVYGEASEAGTGKLVMLPQDKGDESPASLDGSPYGFYFSPSTTGSKKWSIYLQGGGWCYDEVDCYCRSQMGLGTSTLLKPTSKCGCANPNEDGSVDQDCNCLWLPYLDGASFAGYRAKPVPVPGIPNATVTFRGIKNLDAVIDFATKNGLAAAEEAVVYGTSAGGLATFLHVDRIADHLKEVAPSCKKVAVISVEPPFHTCRHTSPSILIIEIVASLVLCIAFTIQSNSTQRSVPILSSAIFLTMATLGTRLVGSLIRQDGRT